MKQRVCKTIPKKHAERPVLVTRQVAVVAMSIVITAPGQDFRFIGNYRRSLAARRV
jgi:hypothetical protein